MLWHVETDILWVRVTNRVEKTPLGSSRLTCSDNWWGKPFQVERHLQDRLDGFPTWRAMLGNIQPEVMKDYYNRTTGFSYNWSIEQILLNASARGSPPSRLIFTLWSVLHATHSPNLEGEILPTTFISHIALQSVVNWRLWWNGMIWYPWQADQIEEKYQE